MRHQRRKALLLLITLPLLFLLIAASLIFKVEVLIVDYEGGIIMLRTPREIVIEYFHSVEGSKIMELLEAKGGCIHLSKLIWSGYGAGMPSSIADVAGGLLYSHGGFYEIDLDRCLGRSLHLNLDYMVKGKLRVGAYTISEGSVDLRVSDVSFLHLIINCLISKLQWLSKWR